MRRTSLKQQADSASAALSGASVKRVIKVLMGIVNHPQSTSREKNDRARVLGLYRKINLDAIRVSVVAREHDSLVGEMQTLQRQIDELKGGAGENSAIVSRPLSRSAQRGGRCRRRARSGMARDDFHEYHSRRRRIIGWGQDDHDLGVRDLVRTYICSHR